MAIPAVPAASVQPHATPLYTSACVRELDGRLMSLSASRQAGAWRLMERAGRVMFHHIRQHWPSAQELLIYCGSGNNGGDGYVIAAIARQAGWTVQLVQIGDLAGATPETLQAIEFARDTGAVAVPLSAHEALSAGRGDESESQADTCVIVDALLGTGFRGALCGDFARAVDLINSSQWPVMAADVPTGLNADSGAVASSAVCAALTVTVVGRKAGLYTGVAADYTGRLIYEPLADAAEWQQASCGHVQPYARLVTASLLNEWMPARDRTAHKGHFGQVLVVGGDLGMGGAPILAAQAAVRAGAGKVVLMSRSEHVSAMLARQPEVMTTAIADAAAEGASIAAQVTAATVVVLGPGLGQSAWSRSLFVAVMKEAARAPVPLVLDADALNLIAENPAGALALADVTSRANWILTPHPGEAARLLKSTTGEVQRDRFNTVRQLQQLTGGNCLLKGAGSLMAFAPSAESSSKVARPELLDVCVEGNPGMASGGMGDVLAGIAGGLLAQGLSSADALRAAVCLHARAADLAAAHHGEQGLLASDLLPALTRLWSDFNSTQKNSTQQKSTRKEAT